MKIGLKVVSAVTLVCFLTTQCVWGAPAAGIEMAPGRELPAYLSIDVPADLGTVDALYEAPAGASPQFILHIQNAHANYQAQMKIKQLLSYMNKKYGFKTIFVEGASEKLDADYLRLFPDRERNLKLCDELAKQGELTGAELFLMEQTADSNKNLGSGAGDPVAVEALGIEEASLYKANYEALKKVFGADADVARFFRGFDGKLDKAASKTFTSETRELIAEWKRFEQGRREFMPFVKGLASQSRKILKVDLESLFAQVGWPQISRLLVIQQMEKDLNKTKGVEEQAALIKRLRTQGVSKELLATLENFSEGSITVGKSATEVSPREVLERLASEAGPKGFKFSDYPAFSLYAGYVTLRSELDPKILFDEIEYLFTEMLNALAEKNEQKELLALYRDGELLRKLLHLELNRAQWHQVVEAKDRIGVPSLVARLKTAVIASGDSTVQKDQQVMPKAFSGKMDELFTAGLEFYDYAHKREAVFYKEMKTAMSERKITKAILITGGFHTDGMSDMFRENAISYGIVTPRLSEKSDENLYQRMMLQDYKYPFEIANLEKIVDGAQRLGAVLSQGGRVVNYVASRINAMMKMNLNFPEAVQTVNAYLDRLAEPGTPRFAYATANGRSEIRMLQRSEPLPGITMEQMGPVQVVGGSLDALRAGLPRTSVTEVPAVAQPPLRSGVRGKTAAILAAVGLALMNAMAGPIEAVIQDFGKSGTNYFGAVLINSVSNATVSVTVQSAPSPTSTDWTDVKKIYDGLLLSGSTATFTWWPAGTNAASFFRLKIVPRSEARKMPQALPPDQLPGVIEAVRNTIRELPNNVNYLIPSLSLDKQQVEFREGTKPEAQPPLVLAADRVLALKLDRDGHLYLSYLLTGGVDRIMGYQTIKLPPDLQLKELARERGTGWWNQMPEDYIVSVSKLPQTVLFDPNFFQLFLFERIEKVIDELMEALPPRSEARDFFRDLVPSLLWPMTGLTAAFVAFWDLTPPYGLLTAEMVRIQMGVVIGLAVLATSASALRLLLNLVFGPDRSVPQALLERVGEAIEEHQRPINRGLSSFVRRMESIERSWARFWPATRAFIRSIPIRIRIASLIREVNALSRKYEAGRAADLAVVQDEVVRLLEEFEQLRFSFYGPRIYQITLDPDNWITVERLRAMVTAAGNVNVRFIDGKASYSAPATSILDQLVYWDKSDILTSEQLAQIMRRATVRSEARKLISDEFVYLAKLDIATTKGYELLLGPGFAKSRSYPVYGEPDKADYSLLTATETPKTNPTQKSASAIWDNVSGKNPTIGFRSLPAGGGFYFYFPKDMNLPEFMRTDLSAKADRNTNTPEIAVSITIDDGHSIDVPVDAVKGAYLADIVDAVQTEQGADYPLKDAVARAALLRLNELALENKTEAYLNGVATPIKRLYVLALTGKTVLVDAAKNIFATRTSESEAKAVRLESGVDEEAHADEIVRKVLGTTNFSEIPDNIVKSYNPKKFPSDFRNTIEIMGPSEYGWVMVNFSFPSSNTGSQDITFQGTPNQAKKIIAKATQKIVSILDQATARSESRAVVPISDSVIVAWIRLQAHLGRLPIPNTSDLDKTWKDIGFDAATLRQLLALLQADKERHEFSTPKITPQLTDTPRQLIDSILLLSQQGAPRSEARFSISNALVVTSGSRGLLVDDGNGNRFSAKSAGNLFFELKTRGVENVSPVGDLIRIDGDTFNLTQTAGIRKALIRTVLEQESAPNAAQRLDSFVTSLKSLKETDLEVQRLLLDALYERLSFQEYQSLFTILNFQKSVTNKDLETVVYRIGKLKLKENPKELKLFFKLAGEAQLLDENGALKRSEARAVKGFQASTAVAQRQTFSIKVEGILANSPEVLAWIKQNPPKFGTDSLANVLWGIVTLADAERLGEQKVAEIITAYVASMVKGKLSMEKFLANIKPIIEGQAALRLSSRPALLIKEVNQLPTDLELAALAIQLAMNTGQRMLFVLNENLKGDAAAWKNFESSVSNIEKILDAGNKLIGKRIGFEAAKLKDMDRAANRSASAFRAGAQAGDYVAILVAESARAKSLAANAATYGAIIDVSDQNRGGLEAAQNLAGMKASQSNLKSSMEPAAELTKEFPDVFKKRGGYFVMDNNALLAVARLLSDIMARAAVSVAA